MVNISSQLETESEAITRMCRVMFLINVTDSLASRNERWLKIYSQRRGYWTSVVRYKYWVKGVCVDL